MLIFVFFSVQFFFFFWTDLKCVQKPKQRRSSSYRHIFGEQAKDTNRYDEIKNPLTTGEGSYCKANTKFFAVAKKGGGGPLYVIRHEDVGRLPANVPLLSVHKGTCWDFDFHPFIENMIATVSDDCKVAVTKFPMEGLKESVSKQTQQYQKKKKKRYCVGEQNALQITVIVCITTNNNL
ncbi:hypothetical protein RFI_05927 [Reticulomyxa filosa]|uniref:DUF1899 domain-containing protein n=1 Tax=Reticulomyxa filosa TaxID=46433 RepID=X6NZ82_RETFI|nr:hypothetical protein RFI_05927 [Reticulomyxa filosa]|eukprot:ETO31193.1 hypothetical protein RFI_05927 [Reticulomyxa filosa]